MDLRRTCTTLAANEAQLQVEIILPVISSLFIIIQYNDIEAVASKIETLINSERTIRSE